MQLRGRTYTDLSQAAAKRAVNAPKQVAAAVRRRRFIGNVSTVEDLSTDSEFERMRTLIRESGCDNLEHFGNGYTHEGGLSLQQNPDEFASLCLFLKRRGPFATYLEIGSASGGAALILANEVGFEMAISIDNGEHPRAAEQKVNLAGIHGLVQFVGDSHSPQAGAFLEQTLGRRRLDVAFIDGDHSAEGVWQDVELTLPFCRTGTLLVFHDTRACDGVEKAWVRSSRQGLAKPLAEFVGRERPLGIGVAEVTL